MSFCAAGPIGFDPEFDGAFPQVDVQATVLFPDAIDEQRLVLGKITIACTKGWSELNVAA